MPTELSREDWVALINRERATPVFLRMVPDEHGVYILDDQEWTDWEILMAIASGF